MKPTPPLRCAVLAVLALLLATVAASCSSDNNTATPPTSPPAGSSPSEGSSSGQSTSPPASDLLLDFVVTDQGLVSMPLPQNSIAATGDRVDIDLTNQSSAKYRLQLFDRKNSLVQQMVASPGTEIDMLVTIPHPGLYTVEFLPEGGGKPTFAALRVTDKPH